MSTHVEPMFIQCAGQVDFAFIRPLDLARGLCSTRPTRTTRGPVVVGVDGEWGATGRGTAGRTAKVHGSGEGDCRGLGAGTGELEDALY